jgi:hypothetical protein
MSFDLCSRACALENGPAQLVERILSPIRQDMTLLKNRAAVFDCELSA